MLKSGFKTSEFLLTILSLVYTNVTSIAGFLDPKIAAVFTAIVSGAYVISRGIAKQSDAALSDPQMDSK